jgi:hypothetical protein
VALNDSQRRALNFSGTRGAEASAYDVAVPHDGDIGEIYHSHSEFSDGKDSLYMMLKEAVILGVDFGVMDHLDLTGISGGVHQGSWLGEFEGDTFERRLGLETIWQDYDWGCSEKTSGLNVGRGAEVDWDPRNQEQLVDELSEMSFDYVGISVHFDGNGISVKSPNILDEACLDDKIEEYITHTLDAIERSEEAGFDVLCHPGRPEEGPLGEGFSHETYYPILEAAADRDLTYEFNAKVHLRYLLNNGFWPSHLEESEDYIQLLPSEFAALAYYPGELPEISVGTDTHRVGHSESKNRAYLDMTDNQFGEIGNGVITESQMRLTFAEDVLNTLSKLRGEEVPTTSILEQQNTREIEIQMPRSWRENEEIL